MSQSRRIAVVAGIFVVLQIVLALAAPWVAPYDPLAQDIVARMKGPSLAHWLGTDHLGRDILSRILYGYRTALIACGIAVGLALVIGGSLGLLAAFYRGWWSRIIMRSMFFFLFFLLMLLAIGIIAMLGPRTESAAIAIAVVYVPIFARLIRGPAMVLVESDFVAGIRSIGATDLRIMLRHILPNLASVILVQSSLLLSAAILVEASLSFLGLGTQPPTPSLGLMLAEGRNFVLLSPWNAIFAGLGILLLSLGFNLLGGALRDELDPRLRGQS